MVKEQPNKPNNSRSVPLRVRTIPRDTCMRRVNICKHFGEDYVISRLELDEASLAVDPTDVGECVFTSIVRSQK